MRVGVVTDSTCDLPAATLRRVGVEAVPLQILVGDEGYLDGRELDSATLYDWMRHQGVEPLVRAPAIEDFMQTYSDLLRQFESVVSIHLSPRFSRTLRHAREAAQRLGVHESITFIDSGSAGAGLAEVVLEAARSARQGAGRQDVAHAAHRVGEQLFGIFSPTRGSWREESDWLRSLRERRHRAQGHRALVAMEGGRLSPQGWARESRVPAALAAALLKRFAGRELLVTVAYASSNQDELAGLRAAIEGAGLNIVHGRMQLIGAAVGARLGPGAATVFARPAISAE